jgi:hypothetical protein
MQQDSKQEASNYREGGDEYLILYSTTSYSPALGIDLEQGTIPHCVDGLNLWAHPCFPADTPDYFYFIPGSVRLLSINSCSSSHHIHKFSMFVLEVFHDKLSNSRQPIRHLISKSTFQAFQYVIDGKYSSN